MIQHASPGRVLHVDEQVGISLFLYGPCVMYRKGLARYTPPLILEPGWLWLGNRSFSVIKHYKLARCEWYAEGTNTGRWTLQPQDNSLFLTEKDPPRGKEFKVSWDTETWKRRVGHFPASLVIGFCILLRLRPQSRGFFFGVQPFVEQQSLPETCSRRASKS